MKKNLPLGNEYQSAIKETIRSLKYKISGLTVFSSLFKAAGKQKNCFHKGGGQEYNQHHLLNILYKISNEIEADNVNCLSLVLLWSKFVFILINYGSSFFDIIFDLTIHNENVWTLKCEKNENNNMLDELAALDIKKLFSVASLDICVLSSSIASTISGTNKTDQGVIQNIIDEGKLLAAMKSSAKKENFNINYIRTFIKENGSGIFSRSPMFYYTNLNTFMFPSNIDRIKINDLAGYDGPRQIIISNTLAFLEGKSANNILLYGDRGTGKSASVKAVCNEYANRGLRLIEVKKNQLKNLNLVIKKLASRALKYILFIDDLTFENEGGDFNMIKAYLEGGIEKKPTNIVIYATSNRRHLLKEKSSDRPTSHSDVRGFDTIQEQLSLSDRFGVTVIFSAPTQEEYLNIAVFLARKNGVLKTNANEDTINHFRENALRWEKWFNGRSPRTALQFVDWVCGGQDFPWV